MGWRGRGRCGIVLYIIDVALSVSGATCVFNFVGLVVEGNWEVPLGVPWPALSAWLAPVGR